MSTPTTDRRRITTPATSRARTERGPAQDNPARTGWQSAGLSKANPIHVVAAEPVANAGFCWERVVANQCKGGVKYHVAQSCSERDYFTQLTADVLQAMGKQDVPAAHSLLPSAISALQVYDALEHDDDNAVYEDVLELVLVEYKQLELDHRPNLQLRAAPANSLDYVPAEHYEMYKVEVHKVSKRTKELKTKLYDYVQAPRSEVCGLQCGGSGFRASQSVTKASHPLQPRHLHALTAL